MATVEFYEKPGCINNTRQKRMLEEAGHEVVAYNLLTTDWTPAKLREFFAGRPVAEWFNRSAPAVKSGAVIPERMDAEQALARMIEEPLLIRRPLMQVGDRCEAGFDPEQVDAWIGLLGQPSADDDLENCPREHTST